MGRTQRDESDDDTPTIGHNSMKADDQLRQIIERIENLEEEKQGIADDIKDVYTEAKANGYDAKVIRKLIAIRKRDQAEVAEEFAMLETYGRALGLNLHIG